MTCRMLINATVADELRVAVVQDGELIDLDIETAEQGSIRGNIYKGVVHNVEGSLAAAFVDFGQHKQGFLPFSEIASHQFYREWKSNESPRITDVIKRGQDILVQVGKDAIGDKGAALTTHLSLAGRFSVLMPGSDSKGVSRKIEDETDRKRMKAMAAKIEVPEGCGYIVRTAGVGQTRTAIQKDLDRLSVILAGIERAAKIARAPSLLHAEPDVIGRTLRDLFSPDIDEVHIDNFEEYAAAREYFEELMPEDAERIHHYANPIPIFSYYHVEEQIEATFGRRVPLPSGGSIVIDRTEALVAVDVNSGKMTSERDHEDTVYKTNFEAAQVVARQLRLRDLGGIVVVDFIDMMLERNQRAVVKALRDSTRDDKARVKISRITSNGLCILTRQRIRQGIQKSFQQRCRTCDGTGWIRTPESHALSLLKRIETRLAQGGVGEVRIKTHKDSAEHITNYKRGELHSLEQQYNCKIIIVSRADMDRDADDVTYLSMGQVLAEITNRLPAREERKSRGSGARKRSRKKDAPSPRRDRAEASGEEGRGRRRRRNEPAEDAPAIVEPVAAAAAAPEPPTAGGTTFTGKPPPEMLEKIKAERLARREARAAKRAAASGGSLADATGADSQRPDSAPPVEDADIGLVSVLDLDTMSVEASDVLDAVTIGGPDDDAPIAAEAEVEDVEALPAPEPARVARSGPVSLADVYAAAVAEVAAEPVLRSVAIDAAPDEVAVEAGDAVESKSEEAAAPAEEAAPAPKRVRSRRKKKTSAPKDGESSSEAPTGDLASAAPTKRKRKRTKRTAKVAPASDAGVTADEAPTKRPRRRSAKAASTKAAADSTPPADEGAKEAPADSTPPAGEGATDDAPPAERRAQGAVSEDLAGLPSTGIGDAKRPGFFSRLLRGGRRPDDAPLPPDEETG